MSQDSDPQGQTIQWGMRLNYPANQEGLVIPVSTWNGFVERVEGTKQEFRPWSIAYSVLFGIGITAGLSIAPLMIADAGIWIVATYAGTSATTILVGAALICMERQLAKHQDSHISQLANEMVQIRDDSIGGATDS